MAIRTIRDFQDLEVWQRAMRLISLSYAIARKLPRHETYGLAGQIRRAAVSVAANIAEGHGRGSRAGYRNQVSIAHGSLMELKTEVLVTVQEGYCERKDIEEFWNESNTVGRKLNALRNSLRPTPVPSA